MNEKKILFSTDLSIKGYKETLEKYLLEKFKTVKFIESGIPLKKDRTIYFKLLREFNKNKMFQTFYNREIKKYCSKILKEEKSSYDYFLVVAGAEFSKTFLKELRKKNKGIKCIIFLWDKLETTSLKKSVFEFDEVYTFDKKDAEKYDFNFLPGFYIDECKKNIVKYEQRKYNMYYIGRLRDRKRYDLLESMTRFSERNGINYYFKLWVTDKTKKNLPLKYNKDILIENKIDYLKNLELLKNSKVTLEFIYKDQIGLSLRALESIATETKLITTNEYIKNYDFYNSKNIYIIKGEKDILNIPLEFFSTPYERLRTEIVEKYSVKGFIEGIFIKN